MNIRTILSSELEEARQLLSRCGWTKKIEDPARFAISVQKSQVKLVAVEDGKIVGFIRAITDEVFNGYISMVAVAPEHRSRGIGQALVQAAMGTNPNITWVLRADREGVSGFYQTLGFQQSTTAMEKRSGAA